MSKEESYFDMFGNPNPFGKEIIGVAKKVPGFKSGVYKLTRETTLHKGVIVPKDYFKWDIEYARAVVGRIKVDVVEKTGKWIWTVYRTKGFDVLNVDKTDNFGTPRGALYAFIKAHREYLKKKR